MTEFLMTFAEIEILGITIASRAREDSIGVLKWEG